MTNKIGWLKKTLEVAKRAQENGNLPFGCILVDSTGKLIEEAENTVITDNNRILHCEINLVQQLAGKYEDAYLRACTLYASTEPCPMCASAIFWAGIGKIVFALSKNGYHKIARTSNPDHLFKMSAKDLLQHTGRLVVVEGPLMEIGAALFYQELLHS